MTDESSEAVKIRPAPNGKFYCVSKRGETICLPNGSLRYFATEHEARAFMVDGEAVAIDVAA